MRYLVVFFLLFFEGFAHAHVDFAPKGKSAFMGVKILDALSVDFPDKNGIVFSQISAIAWDTDDKILYALSDKGRLFHLKMTLKEGKIKTLELVKAYYLTRKNGKKLRHWRADSEGLAVLYARNGKKGDTKLLISFEGVPRVAIFSTKGVLRSHVKIPKKLKNPKHYRSRNKALEGVTFHPRYRTLTACEYPLKKDAKNLQTIYSKHGKEWHFKANPATNSAVTELEMLKNGNVLVLERAFSALSPTVITLKEVMLDRCNKKRLCKTKDIAVMSTAKGWHLDNFEGLTRIKDNLYMMISDDNDNFFQRTLLVLFEIKAR